MSFALNLLPTAIGSLPHSDPAAACRVVANTFPRIPIWPQLPRRSFLENMYVQYSEGFPGVVLDHAAERIYVDRSQDLDLPLERLYTAYLENDLDFAAIGPDYAAGLAALPAVLRDAPTLLAVKGQVTGPISWGLTVVDQNRRPTLYDDILADAIAKHLRLKATWQEQQLRQLCPNVITFVDEPYMSAFGSAFVAVGREQVITLLEEVFAGIQGLKGVHCCGNTDWGILLETSVDILNLDAYNYAESLALYPDAVRAFLRRGGVIAWGISPNRDDLIAQETVASLTQRLEAGLGLLVGKGIPKDDLLAAMMITPACGLGGMSVAAAERVLTLTAGVAAEMQKRYGQAED
jgi:hypothetical protein